MNEQPKKPDEVEELKHTAAVLSGWGMFFVVLTILSLLIAAITAGNDAPEVAWEFVYSAGGLLSFALVLYLFAQLHHIRALLSKP